MYQLYNIQASSVSEWPGRWHEHKRRQRDLKTDMETPDLETLKWGQRPKINIKAIQEELEGDKLWSCKKINSKKNLGRRCSRGQESSAFCYSWEKFSLIWEWGECRVRGYDIRWKLALQGGQVRKSDEETNESEAVTVTLAWEAKEEWEGTFSRVLSGLQGSTGWTIYLDYQVFQTDNFTLLNMY